VILLQVLGCVADDVNLARKSAVATEEDEHVSEVPGEPDGFDGHAGFEVDPVGETWWGGHAGAPPHEAEAARLLFTEGEIRRIALELDDDALDALQPSDPLDPLGTTSREDVHATFLVDGDEDAYEVGLHLKGTSSFETLDGKPAFRIDFHQWDPEARFHGLKRIALQNMHQDETMVHEHAYAWLCARLGLPAQRNGYAELEINGEWYGLYLVTEVIDEQFIDRVWPDDDDGPLYEAVSDDFTADDSRFELQEESEAMAIEDIVDIVDDTSGEDFHAMLETHFDLDLLLTYWALDIMTGNSDGYVLHSNNYYVYGQPLTQRWTLVPAGTDKAFSLEGSGPRGSPARGIGGLLALGCVADARCEERLDDRIREVADAWDALGFVGAVEEMVTLVDPLCEEDRRAHKQCDTDLMLEYIEGRAAAIREQLD
jgi:hypothetical protein